MKRSNFLKSLLIGIVAPKVVVEAMKNAQPKWEWDSSYKFGDVYFDEHGTMKIENLVNKVPPQGEALYSFRYGYLYKDFEKSTWQSL